MKQAKHEGRMVAIIVAIALVIDQVIQLSVKLGMRLHESIHVTDWFIAEARTVGGEIKPERSGFILSDMELLQAASRDMDKGVLAGIYVNKDGEIKGKAKPEE